MKRFTALYLALDETTKTNRKLSALTAYLRDAPPSDAAWAVAMLSGRRLRRLVKTTHLRQWAAQEAELPLWLVEECYDSVGDLAETIALILPDPTHEIDLSLHELIHTRLQTLAGLTEDEQRAQLVDTWRGLDRGERFVWNKLITGAFRVGVQRTLVARALAEIADLPPAVVAHRLMGEFDPSPETFARVIRPVDDEEDVARPYPFFLASPLESEPTGLGDRSDWIAEWKWDGFRAQIIRRRGDTMIWSRGEELVTDRFPDIAVLADSLPDGTVLDGEVLAWTDGAPLPFNVLQTRITRKRITPKLQADAPVRFMAYDLLEHDGVDIRERPMTERRALLEAVHADVAGPTWDLSPIVTDSTWAALAESRDTSRARMVEGLMLKRADSPYRVGRRRGDWFKWKIEPFLVDAVLVYAQRGHGRRAGLFSDYTFSVWKGDTLVPVAKAYSGLTDAEIRKVDRFIRTNTTDRHGPVRVVKPELVFEIAFEAIAPSSRHKSGVAMRFPRMNRWRHDKPAAEADRLETLLALLPKADA